MNHYCVSIRLGADDLSTRCFYMAASKRDAIVKARFTYPGAKIVKVCIEEFGAWVAA